MLSATASSIELGPLALDLVVQIADSGRDAQRVGVDLQGDEGDDGHCHRGEDHRSPDHDQPQTAGRRVADDPQTDKDGSAGDGDDHYGRQQVAQLRESYSLRVHHHPPCPMAPKAVPRIGSTI
ncbi:MAG: hypothetical protein ACYS7M_05740, partial [Planctomycetota bacterium]